jgi:hypothetical protein
VSWKISAEKKRSGKFEILEKKHRTVWIQRCLHKRREIKKNGIYDLLCAWMYVCLYTCILAWMYVCLYTCMYEIKNAWMYVCVCLYTCMYEIKKNGPTPFRSRFLAQLERKLLYLSNKKLELVSENICVYAGAYIHMYACTYACMYVYMYVYMHLCLYVYFLYCMYVCMRTCIYVRLHVYAYMYVYMYIVLYCHRHGRLDRISPWRPRMYVCMYICMCICMFVCICVVFVTAMAD